MEFEITENEEVEKSEASELAESIAIRNLLEVHEPAPARQKKPPREITMLDNNREKNLLKTVRNYKHRTAILLMMDCGLRVTECISLKMKDFDFKKRVVIVRSLKKRGENVHRKIPMSGRLIDALAEYLKHAKQKVEEDWLFPKPGDETLPMNRRALNKVCSRLQRKNPAIGHLHPHALRHTFATKMLSTGTPLHDVSTLLGHNNYNTTLIYNHTPIELMRQHIDDAMDEKLKWYQKVVRYFFPKKQASIINFTPNPQNFLVGRETEIIKVIEAINKNINIIITGKIGVGKTHILKQIELPAKKILKIDELTNLKLTFVNMLLYLFDNDKEHIKDMLFAGFDKTQITQRLQKDSVYNLIEEIKKVTSPNEYILMIESVDGITAKGMKCIELLKDHFTIVTTAREVSINKTSFLWNFEIIDLQPLPRQEALELIYRLSYDIEIENMEVFRNHIYEQSGGNPRVIFELCDRYRKEMFVSNDLVRSVRHIGGIPEIDMSFIIVFILAAVAVMRYTSREIGGTSYRFIGGIALVLLMMSRYFLGRLKRKYL